MLHRTIPVLLLILASAALTSAEDGRKGLRALSAAFREVAEKSTPAVVSIIAEKEMPQPRRFRGEWGDDNNDEMLRRFFGPQGPMPQPEVGQGSGFVVSADGYILTNFHVAGDADRLTVRFHNGKELPGKVVGSDRESDLAVVKVDAKDLPELTFGRSADLAVGDWVVAIGAPFGLAHTVTAGIISAKGRSKVGVADYEDFLQTDAAINPGNSGGPLLDLDGKVIGINTAIASRNGANNGIGFAIPIDMAKPIYEQLRKGSAVRRGFLGVSIQDLTPDLASTFKLPAGTTGVAVLEVIANTPAAKSGLAVGDAILKVNGQAVADAAQFRNLIAQAAPESQIDLEVVHAGTIRKVQVTLVEKTPQVAGGIEGAFERWGFAVKPLDDAVRKQLEVESDVQGVLVVQVRPRSPAFRVGLRPGQIITQIGDTTVTDPASCRSALSEASKAGGPIRMMIRDRDLMRFLVLKAE